MKDSKLAWGIVLKAVGYFLKHSKGVHISIRGYRIFYGSVYFNVIGQTDEMVFDTFREAYEEVTK